LYQNLAIGGRFDRRSGLMNAPRGSPEGDRLDELVTLVEAWERKHFQVDTPN
jgi:HTH-type transcriptional regulator / antitoxin HigA